MDVMFLVLVTFVACIFELAVHRGEPVELPSAPGTPEQGERIVLTILPDDAIEFNGVPVSRAEAIARIVELRRLEMRLPVLISGDRKASLGAGIELLSELKAAGVEHATFQVSGERR